MDLKLQKSSINCNPVPKLRDVEGHHPSSIKISGSKSETNRLLLLQALYPEIDFENGSNSDDSEAMEAALFNTQHPTPNTQKIDIHHAGTAMRFLTAFFAIQKGKDIFLTGSSRMKERPIKILVDALNQLGAEISYLENEGFPPLKIVGKKITRNRVSIPANVSSQYISALLLIAPKLQNGLELTLEGEITSLPYIKMTLSLLNELGIETLFKGNLIKVNHQSSIVNYQSSIESDWSSASYWYSIIAFSEIGTQITLSTFKQNSLQGDSSLAEIYKSFGVQTIFQNNKITLHKVRNFHLPSSIFHQDLQSTPDIAQTIAVTCLGLGINCELTGLHTLKIKETDRLQALKNELEKFGAEVEITSNSLSLKNSKFLKENVQVETYQDHRMAMAFAPLALKTNLTIENAEVVSKSYPNFWNDLKQVGFQISEVSH